MTNAAKEFTKGEFTPLTEGDYLVRMTRVSEVETSKKNGRMIKATFQVIGGDYKNRLIFENFLVEHTSARAQEIGTDRLNNYLKAVGVSGGLDGLGNDRTLLNNYLELPFVASVKIEEGNEYVKDGETIMGKDRNTISGFSIR